MWSYMGSLSHWKEGYHQYFQYLWLSNPPCWKGHQGTQWNIGPHNQSSPSAENALQNGCWMGCSSSNCKVRISFEYSEYYWISKQLSFLTNQKSKPSTFLGEHPESPQFVSLHPSYRLKVNPWRCRCQCPQFRNPTREECPCRPGRCGRCGRCHWLG